MTINDYHSHALNATPYEPTFSRDFEVSSTCALNHRRLWRTSIAGRSLPNFLDFIAVPMVWLSDQNTEASMTFRCTAMSAGQVASVASRICLILFTICALNLPALSQSTAGRILGNVSDSSGAAVAGATVVVTDVQRGTSRTLTTDQAGAYAAPDLAPSTYKIHVEAKGFRVRRATEHRHRSRHGCPCRFRLAAGTSH